MSQGSASLFLAHLAGAAMLVVSGVAIALAPEAAAPLAAIAVVILLALGVAEIVALNHALRILERETPGILDAHHVLHHPLMSGSALNLVPLRGLVQDEALRDGGIRQAAVMTIKAVLYGELLLLAAVIVGLVLVILIIPKVAVPPVPLMSL